MRTFLAFAMSAVILTGCANNLLIPQSESVGLIASKSRQEESEPAIPLKDQAVMAGSVQEKSPALSPSPSSGNKTGIGQNTISDPVSPVAQGKTVPDGSTGVSGNKSTQEKPDYKGQKKTAIVVTPLTQLTDEWITSTNDQTFFSDAYTRVLITTRNMARDITSEGQKSETTPKKHEIYPYKTRNIFTRFISDKNFAINLSVKISDDTGTFNLTTPLMTLQHQSDSTVGEQFQRIVYQDVKKMPLFLVKKNGKNGIITFNFKLKANEDRESHAAAEALAVVLGVAQVVSPESSVITTLSSQANKTKAEAVDAAISKLFSKGIDEQHPTDRDLRLWDSNPSKGAVLSVKIPKSEADWESSDTYSVGDWIVTFDFPRPSIFVDWYYCDSQQQRRCKSTRTDAINAVYTDVEPSDVLSYMLSDNGAGNSTIKNYLAQQPWFATAIGEFAGSAAISAAAEKTARQKEIATNFCRNIRHTISTLGLSSVDTHIVTWAVANGMELPQIAIDTININDDCKLSIEAINSLKTATKNAANISTKVAQKDSTSQSTPTAQQKPSNL